MDKSIGGDIRINLIPPQKKEEIKKYNRFRLAMRLEIFLLISFIFFSGVLLSFKYILDVSLAFDQNISQSEEKESRYEKIRNLDKNFSEINALTSDLISINSDQLRWSKLFDNLEKSIIPGVAVEAIKTKDFSVTLSGLSATRDDLMALKANLEKDACFSNVDLPLSNLVDKAEIEFEIFFDINKECLNNIRK